MAQFTQEQIDSIMGPVSTLVDAKVAEAGTNPSPAIYTQEQLDSAVAQAVMEAKAATKAELKAQWKAIDTTNDEAVETMFS